MEDLTYYVFAGFALIVAAGFAIRALRRRKLDERAGQPPASDQRAPTEPPSEADESLERTEERPSLHARIPSVGGAARQGQAAQASLAVEPERVPSLDSGAIEPCESHAASTEHSEVQPSESPGPLDVQSTPAASALEAKDDKSQEPRSSVTAGAQLREEPKIEMVEPVPVRDTAELGFTQPLPEPVVPTKAQTEPIEPHPIGEQEPTRELGPATLHTAGALMPPPESKAEPTPAPLTEQGQESESTFGNQMAMQAGRRPARYRPPPARPPGPRTAEPRETRPPQHGLPLEIRLQAHPDRHDFCSFRLLAQRPEGSLPELEARGSDGAVRLIESGDDWYEIATERDLSAWLSNGIVLMEKERGEPRLSWQLSRRDVHVLAGQPGAGLVSTTRLCIGRKHLVLCRASRASEVSDVLAGAGCGSLSACSEEFGAPPGWVFFWPVIPLHPLTPTPGDDILNVLRPQPELELALEGGLWLRDSTWLAGYPPQIRVTGVHPLEAVVSIDGQPAQKTEDGSYISPGHDQPGDHLVWCAGKSRSYSLCTPEVPRESWESYSFPGGTLCGASASPRVDVTRPPVTVPTSNPLLIGPVPGQVFLCPAGVVTEWTGFVPFQVAWALPSDPLHCDRSSCHVLLVTQVSPVRALPPAVRRSAIASAQRRWCQAIRDCRRKGLTATPPTPQIEALWTAYAAQARALWRRLK